MGEIYRSVSVTGTRKLEARRLVGTKSVTQKVGESGESPRDDTADPSTATQHSPRRADKAAVNSAEGRGATPPDTNEAFDKKVAEDLANIQQQRIDVLEQENQALKQSNDELEEKLGEFTQQLNSIQEQAQSEGFEQGYQQGQKVAQQDQQKALAKLQEVAALFTQALESQLEQVDSFACEIAFAALLKMVGEQACASQFTIALVQQALSAVRGAEQIKIHISQRDYESIDDIKQQMLDGTSLIDFELLADPRVTVGGCLIETDAGLWDARLETQLQRLKEATDQALKGQKG